MARLRRKLHQIAVGLKKTVRFFKKVFLFFLPGIIWILLAPFRAIAWVFRTIKNAIKSFLHTLFRGGVEGAKATYRGAEGTAGFLTSTINFIFALIGKTIRGFFKRLFKIFKWLFKLTKKIIKLLRKMLVALAILATKVVTGILSLLWKITRFFLMIPIKIFELFKRLLRKIIPRTESHGVLAGETQLGSILFPDLEKRDTIWDITVDLFRHVIRILYQVFVCAPLTAVKAIYRAIAYACKTVLQGIIKVLGWLKAVLTFSVVTPCSLLKKLAKTTNKIFAVLNSQGSLFVKSFSIKLLDDPGNLSPGSINLYARAPIAARRPFYRRVPVFFQDIARGISGIIMLVCEALANIVQVVYTITFGISKTIYLGTIDASKAIYRGAIASTKFISKSTRTVAKHATAHAKRSSSRTSTRIVALAGGFWNGTKKVFVTLFLVIFGAIAKISFFIRDCIRGFVMFFVRLFLGIIQIIHGSVMTLARFVGSREARGLYTRARLHKNMLLGAGKATGRLLGSTAVGLLKLQRFLRGILKQGIRFAIDKQDASAKPGRALVFTSHSFKLTTTGASVVLGVSFALFMWGVAVSQHAITLLAVATGYSLLMFGWFKRKYPALFPKVSFLENFFEVPRYDFRIQRIFAYARMFAHEGLVIFLFALLVWQIIDGKFFAFVMSALGYTLLLSHFSEVHPEWFDTKIKEQWGRLRKIDFKRILDFRTPIKASWNLTTRCSKAGYNATGRFSKAAWNAVAKCFKAGWHATAWCSKLGYNTTTRASRFSWNFSKKCTLFTAHVIKFLFGKGKLAATRSATAYESVSKTLEKKVAPSIQHKAKNFGDKIWSFFASCALIVYSVIAIPCRILFFVLKTLWLLSRKTILGTSKYTQSLLVKTWRLLTQLATITCQFFVFVFKTLLSFITGTSQHTKILLVKTWLLFADLIATTYRLLLLTIRTFFSAIAGTYRPSKKLLAIMAKHTYKLGKKLGLKLAKAAKKIALAIARIGSQTWNTTAHILPGKIARSVELTMRWTLFFLKWGSKIFIVFPLKAAWWCIREFFRALFDVVKFLAKEAHTYVLKPGHELATVTIPNGAEAFRNAVAKALKEGFRGIFRLAWILTKVVWFVFMIPVKIIFWIMSIVGKILFIPVHFVMLLFEGTDALAREIRKANLPTRFFKSIGSARFQFAFVGIAILYIVLHIADNQGQTFFSEEVTMPTPATAEQAHYATEVETGIHIYNFSTLDLDKGKVATDAVVWFKFDPGTESAETMEHFEFKNGQILSKSKPVITHKESGVVVSYQIKAAFNLPMNHKNFPFGGHRLNLILQNNEASPRELVFTGGSKNIGIGKDADLAHWNLVGKHLSSGVLNAQVGEEKPDEKVEHPSAVFTLELQTDGMRPLVTFYLPMFLLFLLCLFSLLSAVMDQFKLQLAIVPMILLATYRLAIDAMAPKTRGMTHVDFTYFVLAGLALLITLFNLYLVARHREIKRQGESRRILKIERLKRINSLFVIVVLSSLIGAFIYWTTLP